MDKIILTSSNACLGQMNRLYQVGFIRGDECRSLHLTSIQGLVQMKPSFEYFDIAEKRLKDQSIASGSHQDEYSTEEEPDYEVDSKPELVTLKYGVAGSVSNSSPEEQNWINARYNMINNPNTHKLKERLICKQQNFRVQVDLSNDDLIKKSVDYNFSIENIDIK